MIFPARSGDLPACMRLRANLPERVFSFARSGFFFSYRARHSGAYRRALLSKLAIARPAATDIAGRLFASFHSMAQS